jgi:hypothetical protein
MKPRRALIAALLALAAVVAGSAVVQPAYAATPGLCTAAGYPGGRLVYTDNDTNGGGAYIAATLCWKARGNGYYNKFVTWDVTDTLPTARVRPSESRVNRRGRCRCRRRCRERIRSLRGRGCRRCRRPGRQEIEGDGRDAESAGDRAQDTQAQDHQPQLQKDFNEVVHGLLESAQDSVDLAQRTARCRW